MYYWVQWPGCEDPKPFPSLDEAVTCWIDALWQEERPRLEATLDSLRQFSILSVQLPSRVDVAPMRYRLLRVRFYTTDELETWRPPVDAVCGSGSDEDQEAPSDDPSDYLFRPRWEPPGPVVPAEDVFRIRNPETERRLNYMRQQLTLIGRMAAVQEDEWFASQAVAGKVRFYQQRGEEPPGPVPRFSCSEWRVEDMPVEGPLDTYGFS